MTPLTKQFGGLRLILREGDEVIYWTGVECAVAGRINPSAVLHLGRLIENEEALR